MIKTMLGAGLVAMAAASKCTSCWPGTAGDCQQANSVCWNNHNGRCPTGTYACEDDATPAPTPAKTSCTGCAPGTAGVCQQQNGVCWDVLASGQCPTGTLGCAPDQDPWPSSNTNQCLERMAGIGSCSYTGPNGLPKDIPGCCEGLAAFVQADCFCNPSIGLLLGDSAAAMEDHLQPFCRSQSPDTWGTIGVDRECEKYNRHTDDCALSDLELEAARLANVFQFNALPS